MIANYTYYTSTYRGNHFKTQEEFENSEKRAERHLKNYVDLNSTTFTDEEKMCACSLSEIISIYNSDIEKSIKGINSESVSGYSVSYSPNNSYRSRIKDEIELWLGNKAIKCRGVGRHVL